MTDTALVLKKHELKAQREERLFDLAHDVMRNPLVEIVLGYVIIEALQNIGLTKERHRIKSALTGNIIDRPILPIIPETAGSVAEAGLLVAVALQQPGGYDFIKTVIGAGGEALKMGAKLIPGALTALK